MKVSIDGGGICASVRQRFGNYIVTTNLLSALSRHDRQNIYNIYSFCQQPPGDFDVNNFRYRILQPKQLWMKLRVSLEELLERSDIFLALNQATPGYTPAKIISLSHGLSFHYFPHYYRNGFIRFTQQFKAMVSHSDKIIVSSVKVKSEFNDIFPKFGNIHVLPFGVPQDMIEKVYPDTRKDKFFMFVGMNHPIKNIRFIVKSFKQFTRMNKRNKYRLFLIGISDTKKNLGNNIIALPHLSRPDLKNMYRQATACLTASYYESFNLPVLEALSMGCPVIGLNTAIIPELKPYCQIAHDSQEFQAHMLSALSGKIKKVQPLLIRKKFSWDDFAKKLIELYR